MTAHTDITVRASNGEVIAAVEVKNLPGLDALRADDVRRNLLSQGAVPPVRFFLLISQERGFLWRSSAVSDARQPIEFPMTGITAVYAPGIAAGERLRGAELELAVMAWLSDLARGVPLPAPAQAASSILDAAGFLDAVRETIAVQEAA